MAKPNPRYAELDRLGQAMSDQTIRLHEAIAARLGLGGTDHKCLALAMRPDGEPVTAGYLAQKTGLTTGAITGVLDRLERGGFIRRDKDPADRRQVLVRVLPDRVADVEAVFAPFQRALHQLYARYEDDDLDLVLAFLRDMSAVVERTVERMRDDEQTPRAASTEDAEMALGDLAEGRLELGRGAEKLTLRTTHERVLYRAKLEGAPLTFSRRGEVGKLEYKRSGLKFFDFRGHSGELALSDAVPWSIRIRGGAQQLRAQLAHAHVLSFAIEGGCDDVVLELPKPRGVATLEIRGGCNALRIVRPTATAARVVVSGGANDVAIDTLALGAIGGDLRWETPNAASARDRWEVEVSGGANGFRFGEARGA